MHPGPSTPVFFKRDGPSDRYFQIVAPVIEVNGQAHVNDRKVTRNADMGPLPFESTGGRRVEISDKLSPDRVPPRAEFITACADRRDVVSVDEYAHQGIDILCTISGGVIFQRLHYRFLFHFAHRRSLFADRIDNLDNIEIEMLLPEDKVREFERHDSPVPAI